jgi:SAM-dependent methyltransferase
VLLSTLDSKPEISDTPKARRHRRRAQRALERQLKYQQNKAVRIRGHESTVISSMKQMSERVRDRLQELRPVNADARVLEVGSGAHGLIFFFGGAHNVGVDPLAHSYASLFPAWQRKAATVAAAGEALPFADHSFDVVLCDNVVDHAESPQRIVSEILRVLAPSGLLYFTVNVHHPIYSLASSAHETWQSIGINYEIGPFADHTVHLTQRRAEELFAGQPLRILKETNDVEAAKARARQLPPRHLGDRLKRVFFKNALYEVIGIKEGQSTEA